ncbi:MAG: acyl-CoA dehydrogenase [Deltaproteobacteria bacterium]|nr:acyl-CoA dehydrogenase [Deltaproteobacteria bacterium]
MNASPEHDAADLEAFRLEVRQWLDQNSPPKPDFKLPDSFLEVSSTEQFEHLRAWQRSVYDAGYLGMSWPREFGGGGFPQAYQSVVNEEMAARNRPFMLNIVGLMWAGPVILKFGTPEQKKRYLAPLLRADEIWCQGFSEPENGSDLANVQTTAVRDDGDYVINGTKIWTSLGTQAHHMILLARTDPAAGSKYRGLTFFLAPVDGPGVSKRPIRKMTGEYGFNETHFSDARVPASCVLGEEGQGWTIAMATLAFERYAEGGQAGGLDMVQLRVAELVQMARECRRDGRPAIDDPVVRENLTRLSIEERAIDLNDLRRDLPGLCRERPEAIGLMRKLVTSEFRRRMCRFAVSLQGEAAKLYIGDPDAYQEGDWQRHYMNAYSVTIGGGTSQIQSNILGERVLGLDKG